MGGFRGWGVIRRVFRVRGRAKPKLGVTIEARRMCVCARLCVYVRACGLFYYRGEPIMWHDGIGCPSAAALNGRTLRDGS